MLLANAIIINENRRFKGYVRIVDGIITEVAEGRYSGPDTDVTDLDGCWLIPGVIDSHVHFREPGLTDKADIRSESRAAAAGGVTSFFDMPNCRPATVTADAWRDKMARAAKDSAVNYAFYIGATADNIDTLRDADYRHTPGVKLFLGQSTGSMQVTGEALDSIFSLPRIISVHSEGQGIIDANAKAIAAEYPDGEVPVERHPDIRNAEACLKCTREAVERAERLGTRLHILHITTADELQFLAADRPLEEKSVTAEACVAHLWFDADDYRSLGARIKCNPAVKDSRHRLALLQAVADGRIDVVSTDHAPHRLADKEGGALKAASGMPSIQFSLQAMTELSLQGHFPMERVVEVMAHNQARLFGIERRGFIRPGYYADLTVIDPRRPMTVTPDVIVSKCGWSPYEGVTFSTTIAATYVNGRPAGEATPMPLAFGID